MAIFGRNLDYVLQQLGQGLASIATAKGLPDWTLEGLGQLIYYC
jgi:hypothetical protein